MTKRHVILIVAVFALGAGLFLWLRPGDTTPHSSSKGIREPPQRAANATRPRHARALTVQIVSGVDGRPVPGATVRILAHDGASLGQKVSTTGGSTSFELLGDAHVATAAHPTEGLASTTIAADESNVTLILPGCAHRLHGVIGDASGGAVEEATICEVVTPEGTIGACGTSERDGSYSLCLWPGKRTLRVAAANYATLDLDEMVRGVVRRDVDLVPAARIRGRVVTTSGEAAEGAAVMAAPVGDESIARAGGGKAVSGLDGRFELDDLAPGDYVLSATSGSHASPRVLATATASSDDFITLTLSPRPVVQGRVSDGKVPVASARVSLRTVNTFEVSASAVTGADGGFTIESSPVGDVEVIVERHIVVSPGRLAIPATGAQDVEVVVSKGASIAGHVLHRGRAAIHAMVLVAGQAGQKPLTTLTDATGAFWFQGLAAGRYTITGQSDSLAAFSSASANIEVNLKDGEQRAGVELILNAGARLTGSVRDVDGKAVVGAEIVFNAVGKEDLCGTTSDGKGRFECTLLEGDANYVPVVRYSARSRRLLLPPSGGRFAKVFVPRDGTATMDLVVDSKRGAITGRVVDVTGAGVPDVMVISRDRAGAAPVGIDATDNGGGFSISAMTGEHYTLSARGHSGALAYLPDVVADGTPVELRLNAASRIVGSLDGFADENLRVVVQAIGSSVPREALVNGRRYETAALLPGTYVVVAHGGGKSDAARVPVAVGEVATVNLTVREDREAVVLVKDFESGAPLPGTRCRASRTEDGVLLFGSALTLIGTADDNGQIRSRLPLGRVEVSCEGRFNRQTNGLSLVTIVADGPAPIIVIPVVQKPPAGPANSAGLRLITDSGAALGVADAMVSVIREVRPGSRAEAAGVEAGDVLLKVDQADVRALTGWAISWLLGKRPVGTRSTVVVRRVGVDKSFVVEVESPWAD